MTLQPSTKCCQKTQLSLVVISVLWVKILEGPEVDRFFEIQRDKIKTLELGKTKTSIHGILNSLSSIENLILWSVKCPWEEGQQVHVPSLKSFSFVNGRETASQIIKDCTNLQVIRLPKDNYFHHASDTQLILDSGKAHLLPQFSFYYSTNPQILTDFANANPKLRKLEFGDKKCVEEPDHREILSQNFTKLLNATQQYLEYLGLGNLCGRYEIQIPQLANLKTLVLGYFDSRCERSLPCDIYLQHTFPNLVTLDCSHLHCEEDDDFDSYFPPLHGTFSSVKNLQVPDNCTELWMTRLHQLCPNFKNLTIHSTIWLEDILEKTFKLWQHLETIHIIKIGHVNYLYPGEYFVPNLDPVITGCSEGGYENLKDRPFICDMKKLKRFFISFKPEPEPKRERFEPEPITHLSGIRFQLLPNLKVTISYDYNCENDSGMKPDGHSLFELVAPYVNFRHKCYTKEFWQD